MLDELSYIVQGKPRFEITEIAGRYFEGSPLGGYDMALARVRALLDAQHIHFVPGVNEDLAATSVLGSQIVHVLGESRRHGAAG